ncbi:MAG: DUF697 domain-containing protein [Acetobacteraceae bacterium]
MSEVASGRLQPPLLLQAEQDGPQAIGADWNPPALAAPPSRFGSAGYLGLGFGILLASWLLVSVVTAIAGAFAISPGLGAGATLLAALGAGLVAFAGLREWRSLRRLRQVEALRAALRDGADPEAARRLSLEWLGDLGRHVPEAAAAAAMLADAADPAEIRALLRGRLADRLRGATRAIGLRAASEAGALVAISPHPSWDGLIVALRGVRVIRQVAELHGLRPGPVVTMALFGRVARSAVETATVDLMSQAAADHVLNGLPVIKHLGAISGASTAAFRLYRLTQAAGQACSPLAE